VDRKSLGTAGLNPSQVNFYRKLTLNAEEKSTITNVYGSLNYTNRCHKRYMCRLQSCHILYPQQETNTIIYSCL
jgi:hypothetical protein